MDHQISGLTCFPERVRHKCVCLSVHGCKHQVWGPAKQAPLMVCPRLNVWLGTGQLKFKSKLVYRAGEVWVRVMCRRPCGHLIAYAKPAIERKKKLNFTGQKAACIQEKFPD
eukprot:1158917-Pelagomonas_calceolata.AAC.6